MSPSFYYRPYYNEWTFLRAYRGPLDVVLLRSRHLAPHPPGSQPAARGATGRELVDAVVGSRRPFVYDPDTAFLAAGRLADLQPRWRLMPAAGLLSLPLTPVSFASGSDRRTFGQVVLADQAGASQLVPPYFRFDSRRDPWLSLNLAFVSDARALGDPREVAAFVHGTLRALCSGEVAATAPAYAAAGAQRVFVRIAGFDPTTASGVQVRAYRDALHAFAAVGVPAVADSVGRFGLVLCAGGADGFSSGASHHHAVSADLLLDQAGGSGPVQYEVPGRWYAVTHSQARRDASAGLLPACPNPGGCAALTAGAGPSLLKEHLIHYFTLSARAVAAAGSAAARTSLRSYGRNPAWLSAL
jgi:hypothetical protein